VANFSYVYIYILVFIFSMPSFNVMSADPTRPPNASNFGTRSSASSKPKQLLTAIFIKHDNRIAVINNHKYQVGDKFQNQLVVKIEPYRVLLKSDKGNYYLTLVPKVKQKK